MGSQGAGQTRRRWISSLAAVAVATTAGVLSTAVTGGALPVALVASGAVAFGAEGAMQLTEAVRARLDSRSETRQLQGAIEAEVARVLASFSGDVATQGAWLAETIISSVGLSHVDIARLDFSAERAAQSVLARASRTDPGWLGGEPVYHAAEAAIRASYKVIADRLEKEHEVLIAVFEVLSQRLDQDRAKLNSALAEITTTRELAQANGPMLIGLASGLRDLTDALIPSRTAPQEAADRVARAIAALNRAPDYYPHRLNNETLMTNLRAAAVSPETIDLDRLANTQSLYQSHQVSETELQPAYRLISESPGPWVVLGDPGAGKSTLLKGIAAHRLERGLPTVYARVSDLGAALDEHGTSDAALFWAMSRSLRVDLSHLQLPDRIGDAWLLIDALDEAQPREQGNVLAALEVLSNRGLHVVLSSRLAGYSPISTARHCYLGSLDLPNITTFAKSWLTIGSQGWRRFDQVRGILDDQRLLANPLMLGFVCFIAEIEDVPTVRPEIYRRFILHFLMKAWHPIDARRTHAAAHRLFHGATEIAWRLARPSPRRTEWRDLVSMEELVVERHEDLVEAGLLIPYGSTAGTPTYRWMHKAIHEFLVAVVVAERLRSKSPTLLDDLCCMAFDHGWENTSNLLMEMLGESDALHTLMQNLESQGTIRDNRERRYARLWGKAAAQCTCVDRTKRGTQLFLLGGALTAGPMDVVVDTLSAADEGSEAYVKAIASRDPGAYIPGEYAFWSELARRTDAPSLIALQRLAGTGYSDAQQALRERKLNMDPLVHWPKWLAHASSTGQLPGRLWSLRPQSAEVRHSMIQDVYDAVQAPKSEVPIYPFIDWLRTEKAQGSSFPLPQNDRGRLLRLLTSSPDTYSSLDIARNSEFKGRVHVSHWDKVHFHTSSLDLHCSNDAYERLSITLARFHRFIEMKPSDRESPPATERRPSDVVSAFSHTLGLADDCAEFVEALMVLQKEPATEISVAISLLAIDRQWDQFQLLAAGLDQVTWVKSRNHAVDWTYLAQVGLDRIAQDRSTWEDALGLAVAAEMLSWPHDPDYEPTISPSTAMGMLRRALPHLVHKVPSVPKGWIDSVSIPGVSADDLVDFCLEMGPLIAGSPSWMGDAIRHGMGVAAAEFGVTRELLDYVLMPNLQREV